MSGRGSSASTRRAPGSSSRPPGNRPAQPTALKPPPASAQERPKTRGSRDEDGLLVYESQKQQQRGDDQESRNFRRALRFPAYELPAIGQDSPDYESSKKAKKQAMLQQLEELYGPHYSDSDVRLYLKKRQLNAQRSKPTRRGGLPLDDAFERPETFLKLSPEFQRSVLNERCSTLTATLQDLHVNAAWQLYSSIPGLLTYMTMQVAQRLHGLSRATGLGLDQLVPQLVAFRGLAFLHPGTVESRVGLLARVARLDRQRAVMLMMQQPQLWLMDSRQLGPRAEQLALLLNCCTVTALKLIGSCPQLLNASMHCMKHQLTVLCSLLGSSSNSRDAAAAPASPAAVVPLLLGQPKLLFPAVRSTQLQNSLQQQQHVQQTQQREAVPMQPVSKDWDVLDGVQQQLQMLADAAQLPPDLLHQAVLQAPELLQLASPHGSTSGTATGAAAAAAVDSLRSSWLCTDTAVSVRQQYQQQLLQLVTTPRVQQQTRKQQKGKQKAQQGPVLSVTPRYVAADVLSYMASTCQWWTSSSSSTSKPHHTVQLSPLQQLVVQAPALLALSAVSAQSPTGTPTARLDSRAQSLCQQLLPVIHQQYQDVQPSAQLPEQQQQQQASGITTYHSLLGQVRAAAIKEPSLLTQPHAFVVEQLLTLCRLLAVSPAAFWPLLQACPAVLWLTEGQVYERIRVLCGVLKVSAATVRQGLVTAETLPVLLLDTDQVKESYDDLVAAAAASGGTSQAGDVLQHVRSNLHLLLPGCGKRFTCVMLQQASPSGI